MDMRQTIAKKLADTFAPTSLKVVDESHQHAGHAGHRPGGETHFRVDIVSEAFRGKEPDRAPSHDKRDARKLELQAGVHALAIHAAAPDEGLN